MRPEEQGITLALGGGGIKCYAQLGALRVLEAAGLAIRGIAATSGGAILAAFYGLGYSPGEIIEILSEFNIRRLLKPTRKDRSALFGLSRLRPAFHQFFGERRIEDLPLPLAFPTLDLENNESHILDRGPLLDAVLAAIAIPGLLPPQPLEGRTLIDGGVLSPIPTAIARSLAPNCPLVAIALMPPLRTWEDHPFPQLVKNIPWLRLFSRLRFTRALGTYVRSMDLTQRALAECLLEKEDPDVLIQPAVGPIGLFDQVEVEPLVRAGEQAAREKLGRLESLFHPESSLKS